MIKLGLRRLRAFVLLSAFLFMSMAALNLARADIVVPAGGSIALGDSSNDLGFGDVTVAGTLLLQNGSLNGVRNLTIAPGGSLVAGSGVITLSGNWNNAGSFSAGSGAIQFVDTPACSAGSTISGSTTFATLSLISSCGKLYRFAAGSNQTIGTLFIVNGTAALPLRIESTNAAQTAFINLIGQQSVNNLAVTDLRATGVAIGGFDLTQASYVVPATSGITLGAICFALFLFGIGALRRAAPRPAFPLKRKD